MRLRQPDERTVLKITDNFRLNPTEMLRDIIRRDGQTLGIHRQASAMPTVLREGRWRFFFYSNEGLEPPHIHVESADGEAKFWLSPVALVGSSRLKARELRDLEWFVRLNREFLLEAWNDFFGR
jgi:hypothetical protein